MATMNKWLSAAEFDEAKAAINSSQSHQPSKGEQTVNMIEDKFRAVSSGQQITGDIATEDSSLVKDQVINFVGNRKILVSVLEKLGDIHPVIKVAKKAIAPDSLISIADQEELARMEQATEALTGAWSGTYDYPWRTGSPDGPVSFVITQHTIDGRFQCRGIDRWGPFTANGRVNGARITFLKEYEELQGGSKVSWQYNGLLNEDRDEVSGHWGRPLPYDDDASEAARSLTTGALPEWRRLGTFVLYRRPVHYLLCRPSEEEFQENKPRALWKLVRNVAKHWFQSQFKNFTGKAIGERRDKRLTYMELLGRKSERADSFDSPDDESTWAELVRTVHPGDLYLWRNIAQYKKHQEPVHVTVSCDHCTKSGIRKSGLQSSRIVCIECSEGKLRFTTDLCSNCQTAGAYLTQNGKEHTPSHPVIQLRRAVVGLLGIHPVLSHAKLRLKALSDKDIQTCKSCEKELSEKPYWYCVECEESETFMCVECNNRSEKDKPWLLQHNATPNGVHDWIHTMVLHTQVAVHLSIGKRLAQLEAKLDEQVEVNRACLMKLEENQGRLVKLEELLERVVNVVAPAT